VRTATEETQAVKKDKKRDSTTVWGEEELFNALRTYIIGKRSPADPNRKMKLEEAVVQAIQMYLSPPRVIHHKVVNPEEQLLIDGVIDMYRNPRNSEVAMINWLLEHVKNR
jgi:hypothetical protein